MATEGPSRFQGVDWHDVFHKLVGYAVLLFRGDRMMEGAGKSPVDLAQDAILLSLGGKVEYDGKRPLLPVLRKVVFRDFLDLKKSASCRTSVILTGGSSEANDRGLDSLPTTAAEPDVLFRKTVLDTVESDEPLRDYAIAILDLGLSKPADIADLLQTTTKDVENRRKRLGRALGPVRSRLKD